MEESTIIQILSEMEKNLSTKMDLQYNILKEYINKQENTCIRKHNSIINCFYWVCGSFLTILGIVTTFLKN